MAASGTIQILIEVFHRFSPVSRKAKTSRETTPADTFLQLITTISRLSKKLATQFVLFKDFLGTDSKFSRDKYQICAISQRAKTLNEFIASTVFPHFYFSVFN